MLNKMREGEYEGDDHASQLSAYTDGHHSHANGHGNGALANGNGRTNGTPDSGRVLCTTELGLRCVTRREARASVYASAEGDGASPFESRMLLLPKVLLDSAMDVIERG